MNHHQSPLFRPAISWKKRGIGWGLGWAPLEFHDVFFFQTKILEMETYVPAVFPRPARAFQVRTKTTSTNPHFCISSWESGVGLFHPPPSNFHFAPPRNMCVILRQYLPPPSSPKSLRKGSQHLLLGRKTWRIRWVVVGFPCEQ